MQPANLSLQALVVQFLGRSLAPWQQEVLQALSRIPATQRHRLVMFPVVRRHRLKTLQEAQADWGAAQIKASQPITPVTRNRRR